MDTDINTENEVKRRRVTIFSPNVALTRERRRRESGEAASYVSSPLKLKVIAAPGM